MMKLERKQTPILALSCRQRVHQDLPKPSSLCVFLPLRCLAHSHSPIATLRVVCSLPGLIDNAKVSETQYPNRFFKDIVQLKHFFVKIYSPVIGILQFSDNWKKQLVCCYIIALITALAAFIFVCFFV